MKAVLQCCRSGSVAVDGVHRASVGRGMVILLGLMVFVTYNDIVRLIH